MTSYRLQTPIDFCEQAKHIRRPHIKLFTYLRPSNVLCPIWNYSENNSEQKWRPSNRFLPRKKTMPELQQPNRVNGDWGTSVQPLEKLTANRNTYQRANTAELKPQSRTAKKYRKKLEYILFLQYFFRLYSEENGICDQVS